MKPVEERPVLSDPGKRRSRRGIVGLHLESNSTTGPEILIAWYCQDLDFVADRKEGAWRKAVRFLSPHKRGIRYYLEQGACNPALGPVSDSSGRPS